MATNMDVFDTKKVYTEFDFIVGQMNVWRGCEGRYDISTQDTLDEIKERFGYLTKEQMKMVFEEVESGFIWDIEKDDIKHEDYEESDEEDPDKNPYTHPYYCDGGCGKVMGRDQWELDCPRICDFCEEPYEDDNTVGPVQCPISGP